MATGSGDRDQQGLNIYKKTVAVELAPVTYTVSGKLSSRNWPYDGVAGVTVSADTGQSDTTDLFGNYSLSDVPGGSRTITASHDF